MNEPETICAILTQSKTVAILGLNNDESRPSYGVARYIRRSGYKIIPVHPRVASVLGETAYPSLDQACSALRSQGVPMDLVDVFRAPSFVPEVVKDVIRLKIPAL